MVFGAARLLAFEEFAAQGGPLPTYFRRLRICTALSAVRDAIETHGVKVGGGAERAAETRQCLEWIGAVLWRNRTKQWNRRVRVEVARVMDVRQRIIDFAMLTKPYKAFMAV